MKDLATQSPKDSERNSPTHDSPVPAVRVSSVAKSFGATKALRAVDLDLMPGEVHALLGGNGAGKTTLVKILLGATRPDKGTIEVAGARVDFRSVRDAISAGIFPIYQHLSQFPDLTVRENLAAFSLGMAKGVFASAAMPSDAIMQGWLSGVGLSVSLDTVCRDLSTGEMQLLEIARAVAQDAQVLVLDEPTAALTHSESEVLLETIGQLREKGVTILFISHKLDEVVAIADRITVIRDGLCAIAGAPAAELSTPEIVLAMVDDDVQPITEIAPHTGETVAEISGLRVRAESKPIDFSLARGEIVGLAGIIGSGANQIACAIAGGIRPLSGEVSVNGRSIPPGQRKAAVDAGIGFVPTDRHADGVFDILGVVHNTSAASLSSNVRWGLVNKGGEHTAARDILQRIGLYPFRMDYEAANFSGGNQQKLVVARNLLIDGLNLLVMSEPTRGVDVAARRAIHEIILEASQAGVSVLVASSDIDELLSICHRILIVQNHEIKGAFEHGSQRHDVIGALAGAVA